MAGGAADDGSKIAAIETRPVIEGGELYVSLKR
jgi:hypothetical protein